MLTLMKALRAKKGEKGFGLTELIVVVSILAILVIVAIPVYGGIQQTSAKNALDAQALNGENMGRSSLSGATPMSLEEVSTYLTVGKGNEHPGTRVRVIENPSLAESVCVWAVWTKASDNVPYVQRGENCENVEPPADFPLSGDVDPGDGSGEEDGSYNMLGFDRAYTPVAPGETVQLTLVATNSAGASVAGSTIELETSGPISASRSTVTMNGGGEVVISISVDSDAEAGASNQIIATWLGGNGDSDLRANGSVSIE